MHFACNNKDNLKYAMIRKIQNIPTPKIDWLCILNLLELTGLDVNKCRINFHGNLSKIEKCLECPKINKLSCKGPLKRVVNNWIRFNSM